MAESIQHFAVKTIGMSTVNGRKPCTLLQAARHNLREIQAELGATGHINPRRMADNVIMVGPATAAQVQAMADGLLAMVDTSRLKRDSVQAIEIVFSLPPGSPVEPLGYFSKCLEWLRVAVPLPVLLVVVHMDEAAPHAHVLLLPVKGGKHVGGALNTRPRLKQLRESFFSRVAGPAGLKRDGAKLRGTVKGWAVAAVLARCEAMGLPAAMGPLWGEYRASIEREPTSQMLALDIDVNIIRPDTSSPLSPLGLQTNPIGLEPRAIGLQKQGEKHQALSCVGLHQQTTPASAPKAASEAATEPAMQPQAIDSLSALWAAVGCRSVWTKPIDAECDRLHQLAHERTTKACQRNAERMQAARDAEASAKARQAHRKKSAAAPAGAVHVGHDGLTRVRDEFAHDTAAWND